MLLNLLVLRCADIQLSKAFYENLGLSFDKEKHGNGPEHYATCMNDGLVIELYPATERFPVDHCRLGVCVPNLSEMAISFNKEIECRGDTNFFLVKDPDDRTIELSQKQRLIG